MNTRKIVCFALMFFALQIGNITFAIEDRSDHDHSDLFRNIEVKNGMELSVIDCVALAYKNSPVIKRQKYNLDIAKSNVGIARSGYFPVISAGVGYLHQNNSNGKYYDLKYRELPNVGVSINQLVYDFGKTTANIKMEEFYKIGAEYEFMDSLCHTLFDVKRKYYALLRAQALLNVAQTNLEVSRNFVELAKGKTGADISTAELYLEDANLALLNAKNEYKNAKLDLSNSMYLTSQPEFTIKNTKTFTYQNNTYSGNDYSENIKPFEPEVFTFSLDKAVDIAYENSPDLQVLINTKNAMEESLKYVKRKYLPNLTAGAGYGYLNTNTQSSNNGLTVGVNLTTDVNLMELKHSIKGASAQLNMADNEIELFKKDLYFEVKRALNNVEKSQNQIPIAKSSISHSVKNLKLVIDDYKSGRNDYTALQDAREDYINALTQYVNTLYNYNYSLIQLENAMHFHIVDIHHKSDHAVHYHSDELIKHLNEALDCDEKEVKSQNKKKKH